MLLPLACSLILFYYSFQRDFLQKAEQYSENLILELTLLGLSTQRCNFANYYQGNVGKILLTNAQLLSILWLLKLKIQCLLTAQFSLTYSLDGLFSFKRNFLQKLHKFQENLKLEFEASQPVSALLSITFRSHWKDL